MRIGCPEVGTSSLSGCHDRGLQPGRGEEEPARADGNVIDESGLSHAIRHSSASKMRFRILLKSRALPALALSLALTPTVRADNWGSWRGPEGTGQCRERNLPTQWSATEHVRWKAPLPGP